MNRRRFLIRCAAAAGGSLLVHDALAREAIGETSVRRVAVPLGMVRLTDDFWAPKIAVWHDTTIDDCLTKFEKTGAFDNFDRVAGGKSGGHHGDPWWDGLVYEMITGCAHFLQSSPDAALQHRLDGYIDRIVAAAGVDPDGYVNTAVTLAHVAPRWSNPPTPGYPHDDRFPHTVYNAGCLVEAGVAYQRATGNTRLLKAATRMANFMVAIMGPPPRQNIVPGHAIAEMAFFDLARLYQEHPELRVPMNAVGDGHAYAELAQFWIENRGNHAGRADMGAYDQDDRPVAQQPTLEGHAVRAALLAAGIARGAVVAGRTDYHAVAARWWQNMVGARQYITGGLGAIPSNEGFGGDYELPNNGYCETCAAVAGGFFDQEMFLLTGQAKYADALERVLYNGALSGVSVAGDSYFYTNYLASGPETRRWNWHPCPCCPPMFLKMMGALPSYLYATDDRSIYVNLYAGSDATLTVGGKSVRVEQTTEYPWNGTVRFVVRPEATHRFVLRLRVPQWTQGAASVTVNGKSLAPTPAADGYLSLDRPWRAGDTVTLAFPMPVQRVHADPRVGADVGRVALMRGPVVYCLESLDCGGVPVSSVVLPVDAVIEPRHQRGLLGGVTALHGMASVAHALDNPTDAPHLVPTTFQAIPFYANSNREPATMAVWLAEKTTAVHALTAAGLAAASASHVNPSDSVAALNDGILPRASDDDSIPRFTFWDHRGTSEWVQYDLPAPQTVSGVSVYWWDERRVGRDCRVPQSWSIEYRDGDSWKPVVRASPYGTDIDTFNRVAFAPVETTGVRLVVTLQPQWSAGILEWQIQTNRV